jgi:hypothetical protein
MSYFAHNGFFIALLGDAGIKESLESSMPQKSIPPEREGAALDYRAAPLMPLG